MGKLKKKSIEKFNDNSIPPEPSKQMLEETLDENQQEEYVSKRSIPQHSRQAAFSLLYLFLFSVLMFSLPFAAFFGARHYLQYLDISTFQVNFLSVLAAVVTVNVIIVAYAIVAYRETEYDDDGNVIDQHNINKAQPIKETEAAPAITSKQKLNKKKK